MSSLSPDQLQDLLRPCRDIARRAGAAVLEVARESMDLREKADGSPLTRADLASHSVIMEGLASLEPASPILSEEGGATAEELASQERFWLIDPLDGTKEFVKGLTEYTVNIALIEVDRPVLGVVYAPALDTMWFAADGVDAEKQLGGGDPQSIVPSQNPLPQSAVVSRSHMSDATKAFLDKNRIARSVSHGSSIKICAVAEGAADVYPRYGPTNTWDTGAGAAVAISAGCRVVDLAGEDLRYDTNGGTLREGFIVYPAHMTISI
jgi:3'(2'), 5'-bisphosphate nucleotidase